MSTLRRALKRAFDELAGSGPAVSAGLALRKRARIILAYHNVVDGESALQTGDRSLHLSLRRFREQLDSIERLGLSVVPLAAPSEALQSRPEVVITFDDAYASALSHAVPELARRGLAATLFVAPELLGMPAAWWDLLATPGEGAVPAAVRDRALSSFQGHGEDVLAAAGAEGWSVQAADPAHRIGTEEELAAAMAVHEGLTVGNHTWSHPNLAAVAARDEAEAQDQVSRAAAWLDERFRQRAVPYLAYPYGLESASARRIAARAGLAGALRVDGGWDDRRGDPFALPRLNITPGLSAPGFRARLSGLLA